ncbi:polyhydroxyalkanoate synthesis repressor PhaR [Sneathiella chinensis]|uniref:Methyl-accepting chemotaxis protein n=1 Tax=Sneathiella chinensis TaxID=349750 RepID=A0ABQ5U0C4_9PROT|nr:polyhydroxyalkanoate synthesis repressor PhaR [Sneathiella chinensis]GLQ05294.1 methyl-accepting chemotaxis protein [Sneathiella chinensis]
MVEKSSENKDAIVIKKYANRRLYNTATSSYVTLDHLSQMVKDGIDFVVYDAKSNDDITRSVLTQIIFEEEAKGQNLLPINFLRQLIRFYGDSLQSVVPDYLDMSMRSFASNQEKMRQALPENLRDNPLYRQFEEMGRQNMAMFSQAMKLFSPSAFEAPSAEPEPEPQKPAAPASDATTEMMKEMREQMALMQKRLDELGDKK